MEVKRKAPRARMPKAIQAIRLRMERLEEAQMELIRMTRFVSRRLPTGRVPDDPLYDLCGHSNGVCHSAVQLRTAPHTEVSLLFRTGRSVGGLPPGRRPVPPGTGTHHYGFRPREPDYLTRKGGTEAASIIANVSSSMTGPLQLVDAGTRLAMRVVMTMESSPAAIPDMPATWFT